MEHAHTQYAFTHSLREQRLLGRAETPEPSPKPKTELDRSTYGDFLKQKGATEKKENFSDHEKDLFREYLTRGKPLVDELKKDVDKLSDAQKEKYNELKMNYMTRVIDPLHQFDVSVRENEDQYMEIRDAAEDVIAGLQKLVDEKNANKAPGIMPTIENIADVVKKAPRVGVNVLKTAELVGSSMMNMSVPSASEKQKEVPQTDLEKVRAITLSYRSGLNAKRESLINGLKKNQVAFDAMKYAQDHGTAFSKAQTAEFKSLGLRIAKDRTSVQEIDADLARLDAREKKIAAIPELEKRVAAHGKKLQNLKNAKTVDVEVKKAQTNKTLDTIARLKDIKDPNVDIRSQIRDEENLLAMQRAKQTTQENKFAIQDLEAQGNMLRAELASLTKVRDEVLSVPTLQKSTQTYAANQAEIQRIIQARPAPGKGFF